MGAEKGTLISSGVPTGKPTGYAYLPIIEEDEAENQELDETEEERTEVIANEHTRSLSSSPRDSRTSPLHHEGTITTNEHTRSLSSSPQISPLYHGSTFHGGTITTNEHTRSLPSSPQTSPLHHGGIVTATDEQSYNHINSNDHINEDIDEAILVAENTRLFPNSDLSNGSSEEILSSIHTSSTSCSQSIVEAGGKGIANGGSSGEFKLAPSSSQSKEARDVEECLVISQSSAVTLDEGIASKSESLTSVSESSGDNSLGSEGTGEGEIELSAMPSCSELDAQERAYQALL